MRNKVCAWLVLLSVVFGGAPEAPAQACRAPLETVFFQGHVGTLMLTPNGKVFICDANNEAATQMIAYLRNRKIKKIDAIVVTHPHGDHFAGIPRLLRAFKVERLIDSGYRAKDFSGDVDAKARRAYHDNVVMPFKAKRGQHTTNVKAGRKISLDADLEIKLLGPRKQGYRSAITEARLTNKHSVVTYVRHGEVGIMLPGDSPEDTQEAIARDFPKETRETDVVLLPHHGRLYFDGGYARMLGNANRGKCIGIASRDAQPHIVAKWKQAGLRLYHTDVNHGDIKLESTGKDFTIRQSKKKGEDRFDGK